MVGSRVHGCWCAWVRLKCCGVVCVGGWQRSRTVILFFVGSLWWLVCLCFGVGFSPWWCPPGEGYSFAASCGSARWCSGWIVFLSVAVVFLYIAVVCAWWLCIWGVSICFLLLIVLFCATFCIFWVVSFLVLLLILFGCLTGPCTRALCRVFLKSGECFKSLFDFRINRSKYGVVMCLQSKKTSLQFFISIQTAFWQQLLAKINSLHLMKLKN